MITKILLCLAMCVSLSAQADSALLLNVTQNRIEMTRNPEQTRSIASITKLMTAMVALDYDKDLSRKLTLSKLNRSNLPRAQYTREQLLNAMLVKSDNAAAETLAEDYPGGRTAFIARMNHQAQLWGMHQTHFVDASGLGVFNVSTATDLANMVVTASGYWFIQEASNKKQVGFETKYKKKIRTINLSHTSGDLLFAFDKVLISKTGLTNAAGWCVAMLAEQNGQQYAIIVLGSKNKRERLKTVKDIRYNHVVDTNLYKLEIPTNY